jgi:hypothetical protein
MVSPHEPRFPRWARSSPCLGEVRVEHGNVGDESVQATDFAASYYHWRKEFGGLKLDQAKRLNELA